MVSIRISPAADKRIIELKHFEIFYEKPSEKGLHLLADGLTHYRLAQNVYAKPFAFNTSSMVLPNSAGLRV